MNAIASRSDALPRRDPLAWFASGRTGLDRALFVIAAGMVALSFSNAAWQSLHALGWILLAATMARRGSWLVPGPARWAIPWAAFAGWSALAALLGPHPGQALLDAKKLLNLLAIFLLAAVLRTSRDYRRVAAALFAVMAVQAGVGIVQYVRAADHIAFRAHGTLSHHMTFSGMLLVTAALGLGLLTFRARAADLLTAGALLVCVVALLATLTRSAWIGLTVALAWIVASKNPKWLLALPAALGVLFLVAPELRHRAASILDTRGDYSNVQRMSMYPTGWRMVRANPWFGLGGRRQVQEDYPAYEGPPPVPPPAVPGGPPPEPYEPPDHLHNNPLQIAAESGLPALLAWLAALAVYFGQVARALVPRREVRTEDERLRRNLILGSAGGVAAFLTMGLLEYNFGDSEVALLFAFLLSIPFALAAPDPAEGAALA